MSVSRSRLRKRCRLASIRPGMTYFPRASMVRMDAGTCTVPALPTAEMRPLVMTTTPSVIGAFPVPSMTVAPVTAMFCAASEVALMRRMAALRTSELGTLYLDWRGSAAENDPCLTSDTSLYPEVERGVEPGPRLEFEYDLHRLAH